MELTALWVVASSDVSISLGSMGLYHLLVLNWIVLKCLDLIEEIFSVRVQFLHSH